MKKKKALTIDEFKLALKKKNLKATSQRIAVHKAMLEHGIASADTIKEYINSNNNISATTASVYNILNQLVSLNIYEQRLGANNKMYFDCVIGNHIHLYDIDNHNYKTILNDELQKFIESKLLKKRFKGYKIERIDLNLICRPKTR